MSGFVHLHLKSEYSLLQSACRIKSTVQAAKEMGMEALALTDRGVMFGAVSFYTACIEAGIRPIIGCQICLGQPGETEGDELVLLVMNEVGYRNLSRLLTKSFLSTYARTPRIDPKDLTEHHEGLIALSGGIEGGVSRRLVAGDREGAADYAARLHRLFGDRFYLELTDCGREEEQRVNMALSSLSRQMGIALVATNDVCFLRREDAMTRRILCCIGEGKVLGEERDPDAERYLKSEEEMKELFSARPEALANTAVIAERCRFDFSFGKTKLPRFDPPDGKTPTTYLNELALAGLKKRLLNGDIVYGGTLDEEAYLMRIRYEQVVITSMGYAPYFLIVADFVGWAKAHGIPTGPGRGSGAGSLIAYLIGITEVDPVRTGLLFESFLNPERVSMPDFDIDFCDRRRDEVIAYVTEKYGRDHVCQIVTFGTLAARAAVRDVGRALGMPLGEVDAVARLIPRELKITLAQALKSRELKELYDSGATVKRLIDLAASVEGMPRNLSTHAAGVVITDKPLTEYLPLTRSGDVVLTQYDMDTVARLGLLKFDFLALRYLTVIDDTVQLVRERVPGFSLRDIPPDDEQTYALIGAGRTDGMFQLESTGMRQLLMAFKPRCLSDIMTAIALFRPGPMDSIDKYLENRGKDGGISYPIEGLAPILDETCGCIVYQEQVMEIFRAIAGYSYGKADVVRRAISKKKADVIQRERSSFVRGAMERGVEKDKALALFEDMTDFANYGFKKSHAAAYALLSYQSAYLKTHYTAYYYASLLTSVLGNLGKMGEYIGECAKMGIATLPPDINRSRAHFVAGPEGIRFGLAAIKNVGSSFIKRILSEREQGPFESLYDFLRRVSGGDANKRAVESLIRSGAMDGLGANRAQLLACYDELMDQFSGGGVQGQMDLFGTEQVGFTYPALPDFSTRDKLRMEREVCGMSASGHLLDDYTAHGNALNPTAISSLTALCEEGGDGDGDAVVICGCVTGRVDKTTKNGDAMAFVTLEDRSGALEVVIFPKVLPSVMPLLQIDSAVAASGRLSVRDDSVKLLLDRMLPLIPDGRFHPESFQNPFVSEKRRQGREEDLPRPTPIESELTPSVGTAPPSVAPSFQTSVPGGKDTVYLRVPSLDDPVVRKITLLCEIFEGEGQVVLYDRKEKKYCKASHLSPDVTDFVLGELRALLGAENVVRKETKQEKTL